MYRIRRGIGINIVTLELLNEFREGMGKYRIWDEYGEFWNMVGAWWAAWLAMQSRPCHYSQITEVNLDTI